MLVAAFAAFAAQLFLVALLCLIVDVA